MADTAPQSAASHARWSPPFHFFAVPILLANVIVVAIAAFKAPGLDTAFTALVAIAILVIAFLARIYALGVQDRVIRLEERLRLGHLLPADMKGRIGEFTTEQLIGMRFASDGELADLAKAVLAEGIADRKAIKEKIKDWKADHQRV